MLYLKLYLILLKVAALSFGGAYSIWALLEKEVVIDCAVNSSGGPGWQTAPALKPALNREQAVLPRLCRSEFNALFAVSEVMPGPQVNAIAVFIFRSAGSLAVLLALFALITPGLVIAPLLLRLYHRYGKSAPVPFFFSGAVIATLSILLLFFFNLAHGQIRSVDWRSTAIAAMILLSFASAYFYKLHPLLIIVAGGVFGFFFF